MLACFNCCAQGMCLKVARFKSKEEATELADKIGNKMWDNELLALLRTTRANLQNVVELKASVPNFFKKRAMALTFSTG